MSYTMNDLSESTHLITPVESKPPQNQDNGHEQEDCTKKPVKKNFSFSKISDKEKALLILCTTARILSSCASALLTPFYPLEAEKKGMDLTTIGFVFSVYKLVIFLSSPVFGKYITRIGVKFVYISGIFVGGICTILFGTLDRGPGGISFTVMCILCRTVEALGFSAFMTATMTILSSAFPDHIGSVLALINVGSGVGLMAGPAIGGLLYTLGGFGLPFYVMGAAILLNGIVLFAFLPEIREVSNSAHKKSMINLLRTPMVVVPLLSVFVGYVGITMFDSLIAKHVEPFHFSAATVGSFCMIGPGVYILVSPLFAHLTDVKDRQAALIVFCHCVTCLGFLIVGPSELFPFVPFDILTVSFGFVLIAISLPGLLVPTIKCMMKGAQEINYAKDTHTSALISGLYNCASAFGGFCGPLAGGAVVEYYGFPIGYTVCGGLLNIGMMVLSFGYFFVRWLNGSRRNLNSGDVDSKSDKSSDSGIPEDIETNN